MKINVKRWPYREYSQVSPPSLARFDLGMLCGCLTHHDNFFSSQKIFGRNSEIAMVSLSELAVLEASLLNKSGNVPLHNRFRALFTLKALKSADAIRIISDGLYVSSGSIEAHWVCRVPG